MALSFIRKAGRVIPIKKGAKKATKTARSAIRSTKKVIKKHRPTTLVEFGVAGVLGGIGVSALTSNPKIKKKNMQGSSV